MKVSYNWLKQYIDIDYPAEELAQILTDLGLEVSSIENFSSVKGGLEGVVIGEVIECQKHPDADKLSLAKVNIGENKLLNIVCGAPNIAIGQKVVVATLGTILHTKDGSFEIKKAKIRGVNSEGMICAEDEIGLGDSHDGIMVLDKDAFPGTPASKYFNIENDVIFEIDLTPNRIDAASHLGVARDIAAWINLHKDFYYTIPLVDEFETCRENMCTISVSVENPEACPRYAGVCITGVNVAESPAYIQNKLKAIGIKPINNIVDISNFILHETGQPIHTFDRDCILGNQIIIKTNQTGTTFETLDGIERSIETDDLMICNSEEAMCIAGVMGGTKSGITNYTTNVFIESAYFNPTFIRKTAKNHTISTDSSYRFERGTDVNMVLFALKRAALLITEIAGGEICSDIIDVYPAKIEKKIIDFSYSKCFEAIGKDIGINKINRILDGLEIKILSRNDDNIKISVPHYRTDVNRQVDINEEILRIYGYNNIDIPEKFRMNINSRKSPDNEYLVEKISQFFTGLGFSEIMCNSLISDKYQTEAENLDIIPVVLHNPLSKELRYMRFLLLHGGLESIEYNINRKNTDIKFFEFGRIYFKNNKHAENIVESYSERMQLGIWMSGIDIKASWNRSEVKSDFFILKGICENLTDYSGIDISNAEFLINSDINFDYSLSCYINGSEVYKVSEVSKSLLKKTEISQAVFFASFNWDILLKHISAFKLVYNPVTKFPIVERDLAILIDKNISYNDLRMSALKVEPKLIKDMHLFDVYQGKGVPDGQISYAIKFVIEDKNKTMTDKQIDKIMHKIINAYTKEFKAILR
jgi:phenylalanyl-tRNA synthetase beta chain